MKITRLLPAYALFAALCGFAFNAQAATGTIKVTSIAEIDSEVTVNGKKEIKRTPAKKALPGTEVIFTTTFENISNKTASDIVINNPIPNDMEYKGGSAFGKDCEILFSADGGKTFGTAENIKIKDAEGTEHYALPKQYSHIRWTYKGQLTAGKSGEVGFRATVK